MGNSFVAHLERWLPQVLRDKAIASVREERLAVLGANDFATMLAEYVLSELSTDPNACWAACGIDVATDGEIVAAAGLNEEIVAVGVLGAVMELSRWQGEPAVEFLIDHGVPADDARVFVDGVEVVAEKLSERGRRLLEQIDAVHEVRAANAATTADAPTFAAAVG